MKEKKVSFAQATVIFFSTIELKQYSNYYVLATSIMTQHYPFSVYIKFGPLNL